MMRLLVLPAATVLACLAAGFAFFLWSAFHSQLSHRDWAERAYSGEIAAQRQLASCYAGACPGYVREPVLACAWRHVVVEETKPASSVDLSAMSKACDGLAADGLTLNNAEIAIHKRLRNAAAAPARIPSS